MREFNEIFFIKVFFRILASFFVLVVISIFFFNINDSVVFQTGEILAENPQLDYKAPFEGVAEKILVKEGQNVNSGDTLMILRSEQVQKDFVAAKALMESQRKANAVIIGLMEDAKSKTQNLLREKQLNVKTHDSQKTKLRNELQSASEKVNLTREQLLHVATEKLKMDSTLFKQQVISKLDITNSYDNYSNYKNSLLQSELTRNQIQSSVGGLDNDYLRTQNALDLKLIELRERFKELDRQKSESDKELKTTEENLKYLIGLKVKQYLIAGADGEVQNLYNVKFKANYVNKDELLLSIAPKKGKLLAKVAIPQRDMRYVQMGQEAHLKVDAFNFYDQGILKGRVSYVPERKPKEDFYVLIDLTDSRKFLLKAGYSLRGEIIVERTSIFRFIVKKLFRKIEDTSTAPPIASQVKPPVIQQVR